MAAGFGFSLFATNKSNPKNAKVFAAGLNVFNQLGFHPSKKDNCKSMKWLIYPKPVHLNLQKDTSRIVDIACGRTHSLIATEEGVFAMGNNSLGQCGRTVVEDENYSANQQILQHVLLTNITDAKVTQVVCGLDSSYLVMNSGDVYAFGLGADGQLGNGSLVTNHVPQKVGGDIASEKIVRCFQK